MFGSPQLGFDCAKIATVPESVGFPKRVDTKFAAREHPADAGNEDGRCNDAQQAARRDAASLPFVSRLRKRFHEGDRPAAGAAAARVLAARAPPENEREPFLRFARGKAGHTCGLFAITCRNRRAHRRYAAARDLPVWLDRDCGAGATRWENDRLSPDRPGAATFRDSNRQG